MSTARPKGVTRRHNNHMFAVYPPKPRPTFLELDGNFADLFAFLDQSILR